MNTNYTLRSFTIINVTNYKEQNVLPKDWSICFILNKSKGLEGYDLWYSIWHQHEKNIKK